MIRFNRAARVARLVTIYLHVVPRRDAYGFNRAARVARLVTRGFADGGSQSWYQFQ